MSHICGTGKEELGLAKRKIAVQKEQLEQVPMVIDRMKDSVESLSQRCARKEQQIEDLSQEIEDTQVSAPCRSWASEAGLPVYSGFCHRFYSACC